MYHESIIDIIRAIVQSMTFPVTVNNVDTSGSFFVLSTCDIYHAEPGRYVTIGGTQFKIEEIDAEEKTITVSTTAELADDFWTTNTTFNLYTPYFFHGTPLAVESELQKENKAQLKTPMIWFIEPFEEEFDDNRMSLVERDSDFRIFFLTQANHEKWQTDEAYDKAVEPMRRLAENFITAMKAYTGDGCEKYFLTNKLKYRTKNYAKFGAYIQNKGVLVSTFSDKCGGCEVSFIAQLQKRQSCRVC